MRRVRSQLIRLRFWLIERLRAGLGRCGLQLRRLPGPLARRRDAELRLTLGHVIARHLLRRRSEDFFFIQVGAFDGLANDPIHDLVVALGWRGILLEPQQDAFRALAATYRDQPQLILRNAAIAEQAGSRPLYKIRGGAPGLPSWAPQIASFRREVVAKHGDVIRGVEERIETEEVHCVRFADLPLPESAIDLLLIDAEGADFEIVKLFHADGRKAHIVSFEHKHLSRTEHADCVAFLIERGYDVCLDGDDSIACLRS